MPIVRVLGVLITASLAPTCALATAVYEEDVGVTAVPTSRETPYIDATALPKWDYSERLVARSAPESAVYDISAHVVVMPDGARLEAHSGLSERADVPRFVRQHMRGPTPPALYELAPRERPFHGVAALRLKAISGEVFGRSGLLAHTYMLGGRPESNGCVVFRDYAAFLRSFREGRVKRLRVVPVVGEAVLRIASRDSDKVTK